ncbi:HEC/Ndc80p family-domain-containing protein [Leucosporidium creatinivorum]|uniref:Kinetochore protein NDC80 n=1 Tax=Leucosporidium creatinivorum TaxID=106004 RepID=A0A1Y2FW48_9BASI|nr:HEC/Ndc80p family-domain-containing protein [Leucosporidium creatinivorum]
MAESRRRTLAASGSSSGIPIPASASRPTGNLRASLAPNQLNPRQSLAPSRTARPSVAFGQSASSQDTFNLPNSQGSQLFSQGHGGPPPREAPMTASRNNMYSSLGGGLGTMSVGRTGTLKSSMQQSSNQPYAPPSERRSSTYRRSTLNAPATTSTPGALASTLTSFEKDPRNSRSLETRKRYAADIVQFLSARNYLPGADEKTLMTPTGSQFIAMFKFIIGVYDPAISFEVKGKTFNDLVVPILKSVGYPFANSITKSHLQAAGSQQSWPNMLAMLHWLVQSIENSEQAFISSTELQMPAFDLAHEQGQEVVNHAWLDYISSIYPKFLVKDLNEDDTADELDVFFTRLETSRREQRARVAELEEEGSALQKEWDSLNATPDPIIALQDSLKKIDNDKIKFNTFTKACTDRRESSKAQLAAAQRAKEELQKERLAKQSQLEQLKKLVAAQGMTPIEIQHMTTERSTLQKQTADINKKSTLVLQRSYALEIDLQKQLNSASNVCTVYEAKATALGLLPGPTEGYEHVDFSQEINGAIDNPVPDCTTSVKPAIAALRNRTRMEVSRLNGEDVVMEEKITRVNEAIAELKEIVEGNEAELDQAERDNGDLKETVATEFATMNAELERLQSQVNHLQHTMGHTLAVAEWRYDQRVLEKMQAIEETTELRRVNSAALETALDSLFTYKEHIVEQTCKLDQLAEEYLASI